MFKCLQYLGELKIQCTVCYVYFIQCGNLLMDGSDKNTVIYAYYICKVVCWWIAVVTIIQWVSSDMLMDGSNKEGSWSVCKYYKIKQENLSTHLFLQLPLASLHFHHGRLQSLHARLVLADEQTAITQFSLVFINLLVAVTLLARRKWLIIVLYIVYCISGIKGNAYILVYHVFVWNNGQRKHSI